MNLIPRRLTIFWGKRPMKFEKNPPPVMIDFYLASDTRSSEIFGRWKIKDLISANLDTGI